MFYSEASGRFAPSVRMSLIWVYFISGPDEEPVLECEAVMLQGQKSKMGEVFRACLTVECLACNEGAEDLCAQD